jgi:hypothetical protein
MKFRTIILIVILFALIGAAGFIGWQIYIGSQAPEDAAASVVSCGAGSCIAGENEGDQFGADCNFTGGSCDDRKIAACGSVANTQGSDPIDCGPSGDCVIDNPTAVRGTITLTDGCQNLTLEIYNEPRNGRDASDCFTSANGRTQNVSGPATFDPLNFANGCGDCVQIDIMFNGQPYGTCNCTEPCPEPVCGDGNVDPGEECDPPGSTVGDQICDENCRLQDIPPEPFCGDGNVDPGEECDPPGSTVGDQTCDENCQLQDIPVDPFCGDGNIDDGEQCGEPGLTCPAGNTCNTAQCICEPDDSDCGDPCTTDTDCPNDHVCSDGTCQLPTCVNNPDSCTPNGCGIVELPKTDLESEEIQSILIGIVLMMIGILVYRSESFQRFFRSYMGDIADDNFLSVLKGKDNSAQTHGEKVLEKFENER